MDGIQADSRLSSSTKTAEVQQERRIIDSIPLHDGPSSISMSMPALLKQNIPGYKARLSLQKQRENAVLSVRERRATGSSSSSAEERRFGRRKQRRWENSHFHGSKHITPPRSSDYNPVELSVHNTFPSPPPSTFYPLKHSSPIDSAAPVFDDSKAADFGRFSLPLKGLKRSTRQIVTSGGAGEEIVSTVDNYLRHWLDTPEVVLNPDHAERDERVILSLQPIDSGNESSSSSPGSSVKEEATIYQVSKQPHSLIWRIEDSFVRFLVHSVARYYRVVSLTKTEYSSGKHLIYLLRPNMQSARKVQPSAAKSLETPPTTEWEASSIASLSASDSYVSDAVGTTTDEDTMSEIGSEVEEWSIVDGDETLTHIEPALVSRRPLSDIDSAAEVEEGDEDDSSSVDGGVESLQNSVADLSLRPSRLRTSSAHPAATSALRRPAFERDESLPRIASGPPRIPHMMQREERDTLQKARNSRARTGWRLPELTFIEWVESN